MSHPPSGPRGDDRSQRRMPPPDATGREAEYLLELKESKAPIVVEMLDGTVVRGYVEYYDRDMIKVNRPDGSGPGLFVRKKHVRCISEDAGA